ncbi:Hypothetical protein R9X50_00523200 [Acrodontium crateriforme]|uniref:Uncharacterized protein n=1 Tax=Acrodontium crateriforme TaxID=150365 RepID=A0AAQ3R8Z4_9PEZI|nr:Hypothetical protein R9X50_00523200 [Acrodontium crateriforme]
MPTLSNCCPTNTTNIYPNNWPNLEMTGRKDYDLLARLNALKPSSVTFDQRTVTPVVDIKISEPTTVEDKLAERLKALRSSETGSTNLNSRLGGASLSGSASTYKLDRIDRVDALTAQVRDEVASEERDPIRDWQCHDGDERTLEDLLEELGSDDRWKLDPDEPKHVDALMKEARIALPEEYVASDTSHNFEVKSEVGENAGEEDVNADEPNSESKTDEAEAEDYVKSVLAEIDIERKYGTGEEEADDENEEKDGRNKLPSTSELELPSTPQNLLTMKSIDEPEQSQEDNDLEARFSKLGLDLPSTPTKKPTSKAQAEAKAKAAKGSSKLPTYNDDDIESWCCICNEDGELKCLGCDDDIYCQNCWRDGHGNGPGQERGHRAVQYTKKEGGLATA